jgi:hypothetical protein
MTDDNKSDAMPPTEFDVRAGLRGEAVIVVPHVTSKTIWKQIEAVIASLDILHAADGATEGLERARDSLHAAIGNVCIHVVTIEKKVATEVKSEIAAFETNMHAPVDEEAAVLASAVAALGSAHGA